MSRGWKTVTAVALRSKVDARARAVRRLSLAMIYHARSGHPGGSLSAVDLLVDLYFHELRLGNGIEDPLRDRFVLSKGHACPALYATWMVRGLHPAAGWSRFRKLGSPLQGHPDVVRMPLSETSTGSLGQGFSAALGMAAGLKLQGNPARVYTMLGDGELQEGEVWEGALFAAQHDLANVCAVVDYNKMQSDDWNHNIVGLEPLREKWQSFGWSTIEIDGHDPTEIRAAFNAARAHAKGPTVILAHTLKGRGVDYMEGIPAWHGSVALSESDFRRALVQLGTPEVEIPHWIEGTASGVSMGAPNHA